VSISADGCHNHVPSLYWRWSDCQSVAFRAVVIKDAMYNLLAKSPQYVAAYGSMHDVIVRCSILCCVRAKVGQLGRADATVWYSVVHVSCSDFTDLHIRASSVTNNLRSELFGHFT
jgi:hypothetical protein